MTKIKYTYINLLFVILVTCTGCNKWLDVKPQDGLIKQDFFKTKEHVEGAVIGAYIAASENSVVNQLFRFGEIRADMIALAPAPSSPSFDETQVVQGNILPVNSVADWSNIYRVINYCNLVIDNAPKARESDPTFTPEALNNRLAEMRTLRALLYFYLVRTFRDVPLQLEGVSEDTQIVSLPKSTSQQVLAQIVDDLNFAAENAVEVYVNDVQTKGRVTRYAVNALQADVYLWMNKFAEANAACDKIINSSRYGLVEGIKGEFFEKLYYQGNSAESIFEFQYSTEKPNQFINMFLTPKVFIANGGTLESLFPKDEDLPNAKDLRADSVSYNAADYTIYKYVWTGNGFRPTAESTAHFILYRYADVLLMKAEALAYLGEGEKAIDLINDVRERAKALDITKENVSVSIPSEIENYILKERAREFAFEGKRWFDLLRIARRNNYAKKELIVDAASLNTLPTLQQSYRIKLLDTNSHFLPVPFRDIQANKNLVQNPFYK